MVGEITTGVTILHRKHLCVSLFFSPTSLPTERDLLFSVENTVVIIPGFIIQYISSMKFTYNETNSFVTILQRNIQTFFFYFQLLLLVFVVNPILRVFFFFRLFCVPIVILYSSTSFVLAMDIFVCFYTVLISLSQIYGNVFAVRDICDDRGGSHCRVCFFLFPTPGPNTSLKLYKHEHYFTKR